MSNICLINKNFSESEDEKDVKSDEEEKENKKDKKKDIVEIDKETGLQQIKCDDQIQFDHENDTLKIFPKGSVRILINGSSGTGKSKLLLKILLMLHKPKYLFICTTVLANPVHLAIEKWCKENKIKYYFNLTPNDYLNDLSKVIKEKDKNDHVIILFDDFSDGHTGKDNQYNNCTIRSFSRYRNYNVSCIILSPSVIDCKTNVRNSSNIRILFPCNDEHCVDQFKYDLQGKFKNMTHDVWQKLYDYICTNRFTFIMWGDTINSEYKPHLRIGFNNIVWTPDSKSNNDMTEKQGGNIENKPQKIDRRHTTKHSGIGFHTRNVALQKAIKLGLPPYYRYFVSLPQINRFLKYMENKKGVYNGGNELLTKVLGPSDLSKKVLMNALYRNIKKFGETKKDMYFKQINSIGKEMIANEYVTKDYLRFVLNKHGLLNDEDDE